MGEELFDLLERLESGEASSDDMEEATKLSSDLSDIDMLSVDVFAGDESDVRVLDQKVVKGRRDHVDHYTGLPIATGTHHLVIREMCEGEFLTTRHSKLSLWMLREGYDPSALQRPAP